MKLLWKQIIQSLALGTVLPGMLLSAATGFSNTGAAGRVSAVTAVREPQATEGVQTAEPVMIPVLQADGEVEQMELEAYISRVVLGEMPASFEKEALKAQAVAARTYTLRCIQEGDRHPQGAVCTDYRCCQAYQEPEAYLSSGGTQESIDKVFDAVAETGGEVLRYEGELIYATYFASSGGSTEDAREVWGQAFPYLTAVSSPGEEDTAYYAEQVTFTAREFQERLGVTLKGEPEGWFGWVFYTVGGGVDLMRVGGRLYTGVELRSIFGLRSTVFTVTATEDSVTFETKGYGHRVGLSQYGADAMAASGSGYAEILAHYYGGTTLEQYHSDND